MAVPPSRAVRVGVTEKNRHQYWDMVNAGWQDAAAQFGLDVKIDAPAAEDPRAQADLMRAQLDSGVDVLAFVATDPEVLGEVVAEAAQRGVPTLAFDLDAPTSGRLAFVGMPGIRAAGHRVGDDLAARIPAGAPVIAQTGSDHAPGAAAKLAGFCQSMAEHGHPVITGPSDGEDVELAAQIARQLLADNPNVKGMYGVYGYHPIVQAHAVDKLNRDDVVIVGFDMLPETVDLIEAGKVASSVWIQEYYFGYYSGVLANALARAGSSQVLRVFGMDPDDLSGNAVYPPLAVYTQDNIAEYRAFATAASLDERTGATTLE